MNETALRLFAVAQIAKSASGIKVAQRQGEKTDALMAEGLRHPFDVFGQGIGLLFPRAGQRTFFLLLLLLLMQLLQIDKEAATMGGRAPPGLPPSCRLVSSCLGRADGQNWVCLSGSLRSSPPESENLTPPPWLSRSSRGSPGRLISATRWGWTCP